MSTSEHSQRQERIIKNITRELEEHGFDGALSFAVGHPETYVFYPQVLDAVFTLIEEAPVEDRFDHIQSKVAELTAKIWRAACPSFPEDQNPSYPEAQTRALKTFDSYIDKVAKKSAVAGVNAAARVVYMMIETRGGKVMSIDEIDGPKKFNPAFLN